MYMTELSLAEARDNLGNIVAEVRRTREPVTITRYGRAEVVIVDIEDWHASEALRDEADLATVRERMRAALPPVPLDEVVGEPGAA
jgi:prevent-host-death family protein